LRKTKVSQHRPNSLMVERRQRFETQSGYDDVTLQRFKRGSDWLLLGYKFKRQVRTNHKRFTDLQCHGILFKQTSSLQDRCQDNSAICQYWLSSELYVKVANEREHKIQNTQDFTGDRIILSR